VLLRLTDSRGDGNGRNMLQARAPLLRHVPLWHQPRYRGDGGQSRDSWTGFVLEHNVHFSVVVAVGVVSLPSGFWMAILGNIDGEERARKAVPPTVSGYPVELVTETGAISLRPRVSTRAAGCWMNGRRLASSSSPGWSAALSVDMQLFCVDDFIMWTLGRDIRANPHSELLLPSRLDVSRSGVSFA